VDFKAYFAALVKNDFEQGREHPSLGPSTRLEKFSRLQARLGLKPGDVYVMTGFDELGKTAKGGVLEIRVSERLVPAARGTSQIVF
jgi:hypothetical protein